MPLATTKELLLNAQKGGYAVCAFNMENMEMAQGILAAAKELAADSQHYDQEMTNLLLTAFSTGGIGPMTDMDAAVDAPETATV